MRTGRSAPLWLIRRPQTLHPGNAALKVKTVTGHCRDGLGGLPAGLPLNARA